MNHTDRPRFKMKITYRIGIERPFGGGWTGCIRNRMFQIETEDEQKNIPKYKTMRLMLQDTSTADGAFSHAFKAYQLPTFSNDLFARG